MASEYLQWKYRDVKPDEPVVLTPRQKRRNWWEYHKRPLLGGAVVLAALIWLAVDALGIGKIRPDYQVAYAGAAALAEEDAAALEEWLSALGEDCNGDGRVAVQLNQYLIGQEGAEGQAMFAAAGAVQLMADFESCDSVFFLLEDPEGFQALYDGVLVEDWVLLENGLYLARRDFLADKAPRYPEQSARLWQAVREAGE